MALTIHLDALSLEEVAVAWTTKNWDGTDHNPTSDATFMALVAYGVKPLSGDWHQGTWFPTAINGKYYALLQIGPTSSSGVVLLAGNRYEIYAKLNDNPNAPVKNAGVVVAK